MLVFILFIITNQIAALCLCRVVVFIDLLSELIESAAAKYNVLTESQKVETATYIIPEVTTSLIPVLPLPPSLSPPPSLI